MLPSCGRTAARRIALARAASTRPRRGGNARPPKKLALPAETSEESEWLHSEERTRRLLEGESNVLKIFGASTALALVCFGVTYKYVLDAEAEEEWRPAAAAVRERVWGADVVHRPGTTATVEDLPSKGGRTVIAPEFDTPK